MPLPPPPTHTLVFCKLATSTVFSIPQVIKHWSVYSFNRLRGGSWVHRHLHSSVIYDRLVFSWFSKLYLRVFETWQLVYGLTIQRRFCQLFGFLSFFWMTFSNTSFKAVVWNTLYQTPSVCQETPLRYIL